MGKIKIQEKLETLKNLGFTKAYANVTDNLEFNKKLHTAYQNYEFITPEDIQIFRSELRGKTIKRKKTRYATTTTYDSLEFIRINNYEEVPPNSVLVKLQEAKSKGCFDSFEIAKVVTKQTKNYRKKNVNKNHVDPILFGRIAECGDYFFVTQWGNDVTVEIIRKVVEDSRE